MENYYKKENYERSGEFIENFVVDDIIEFCHRWFGLANVNEFFKDWDEYNNKYRTCYNEHNQYNRFSRNKEENRDIQVPIHEVKKAESPITFLDNKREGIKPIIILSGFNGKEVKYNGFVAGAR